MNAREFASVLKKTIEEAKASGTVAIDCENLIDYLDEVLASAETPSSPLDIENHKAQQLQSKHQHEDRLEMFRSIITFGQGAIKSIFLLNGGASVAFLAFLGHFMSSGKESVDNFFFCLFIFASGALVAAMISGFTYLSQWFYDGSKAWRKKLGFCLHIACIALGIASYMLFAWGLFATYSAFIAYG